MFKRIAALVFGAWLSLGCAFAQSSPNLTFGQVPTPAQWNSYFQSKQDVLGYTALSTAGGTMTGRLVTAAPGATTSGLNLIPGSTPSSPANGDLWVTSVGLFAQINGTTIGPLGTLACPTCVTNNTTNTFTAYQIVNLNAASADSIQTGTILQLSQADTVAGRLEMDVYAANASLTGLRADGTKASPTALIANDEIMTVSAWGYDGTTRASTAASSIRQYAGGSWSNTSHPAYIDFSTTAVGSTTLTSRARIENDGGVTVGGAASQGIGTLNLLNGLYANGTAPTGTGGYVRSVSPVLTSPTATTLAIGGVGLGGNALAISGTAMFTGSLTIPSVILQGSTSGNLTLTCAALCGSSSLKLPNGVTDFSGTGGTSQVVKQTSSGGPLTVGQLNFTDLAGTVGAGQFATGPGIVALNVLNNANAATITGNATSGSAVRTDIDISALTDITTPNATLDFLLIKNHTTGTLQKTTATELLSVVGAGVTSLNTAAGVLTLLTGPQGRLTLQLNTPVMVTTQAAQSTLRYDCYNGGDKVPYYTGTADAVDVVASCEVTDSMVSAASAGQIVSGQVYDVWWEGNSHHNICVAMSASTGGGGGWASDGGSNTARGTGYSQLDRTSRPYITNKNAITNCFNAATNYGSIAANRATYLGTFYASANGQISYNFGAIGTGGSAATAGLLGLWNMYNRVNVSTMLGDNATSWTYGTPNTWRQAHASAGMQVQYVVGLNEDSVSAAYAGVANNSGAASSCNVAVGLDSTSTQIGIVGFSTVNSTYLNVLGTYRGNPGIGFHSLYALEYSGTGGTCTFGGTLGVSGQPGFTADLRM